MPDPINLAGAHLIGQPADVYECYPMVLLRCKCSPDNAPAVIRGIDAYWGCPRCRSIWAINKLHFDRSKGPGVEITVSIVGKLPTPASTNGS